MPVFRSLDDPQLIALLQSGSVGVLPTDTIYGLAGLATRPDTVAKLYALKAREHKPGTIIAANLDQLISLGIEAALVRKVAHLWPNPISIVLDAPPALNYLDQGVGSLAVRVPKDEALIRLLLLTGPLVTSSANHQGQEPAAMVADAQAFFEDEVAFYVDGGTRAGHAPSTVVRLQPDGTLETLRSGAVLLNEKGEIV